MQETISGYVGPGEENFDKISEDKGKTVSALFPINYIFYAIYFIYLAYL